MPARSLVTATLISAIDLHLLCHTRPCGCHDPTHTLQRPSRHGRIVSHIVSGCHFLYPHWAWPATLPHRPFCLRHGGAANWLLWWWCVGNLVLGQMTLCATTGPFPTSLLPLPLCPIPPPLSLRVLSLAITRYHFYLWLVADYSPARSCLSTARRTTTLHFHAITPPSALISILLRLAFLCTRIHHFANHTISSTDLILRHLLAIVFVSCGTLVPLCDFSITDAARLRISFWLAYPRFPNIGNTLRCSHASLLLLLLPLPVNPGFSPRSISRP